MEPEISIMDLPPSVIVNIYSYLHPEDILSMRKICPIWSHLSYDESVWKNLNTNNCTKRFLSDGSFCNLLREVDRHVEVLHFDIQYISILEYLAESENLQCENLQELSIFNYRMLGKTIDIAKIFGLDQMMVRLSEKCKKLRKLHYEKMFINTQAIFSGLKEFSISSDIETVEKSLEGPSVLKSFLQRHPQLESIDLDLPVMPCNRDISIHSILSDLPNLKKLTVLNTISEEINPQLEPINHQVHLESLRLLCLPCLTDETVVAILEQSPDLKVFDVRLCEQISDKTLRCLAENCHKIKTFAIIGDRPVLFTSAGMKEVAYNCPQLDFVSLYPTSDDDDQDVYSFISHCPQLKYFLTMGGITDHTLEAFAEMSPAISYLDLLDCPKLTGHSIATVLRRCKNLSHLRLDGCRNIKTIDFDEGECIKEMVSDKQEMVEVNSDEEKSVKEKHLDLKELEHEVNELERNGSENTLNQPRGLTETLEKSSAFGNAMFYLEFLYMNNCFDITDKSLYNLACHCSNLRKLYLSGCSDLSDNTVKTFFQNNPFLFEFDISLDETDESVVEKVTPEGFSYIAKYGKNLQLIKLDFRNTITTEALFEVISKCPVIKCVQILTLKDKTDFTKQKVMKYASACSHKYICMKLDGPETTEMACIDIHITDYKPSYSKKYFYCNFK